MWTSALFFGPPIVLVWTSGDVCPRFQSQVGFLLCVLRCLCAIDSSDLPLMQHPACSICTEVSAAVNETLLGDHSTSTNNSFAAKMLCHIQCCQSRFPMIHEIVNVGIIVQLLMEMNWQQLPAE